MSQIIKCICCKKNIPLTKDMAEAYVQWNSWLTEHNTSTIQLYRSLQNLEKEHASYQAVETAGPKKKNKYYCFGETIDIVQYCIAVHYSQAVAEQGQPNSWHFKLVVFSSPECLKKTKEKIKKENIAGQVKFRQMLKFPGLLASIMIPMTVLKQTLKQSALRSTQDLAPYLTTQDLNTEFGQLGVGGANSDSDDDVTLLDGEDQYLLREETDVDTNIERVPGGAIKTYYQRFIEQIVAGDADRSWSACLYDRVPRWHAVAAAAGAAFVVGAIGAAGGYFGRQSMESRCTTTTTAIPPTCPPAYIPPQLNTSLASCPPGGVPGRGDCQTPGFLSGYLRNVTYTGNKVLTRSDVASIQFQQCVDQIVPFSQLWQFYLDCSWTGPGAARLNFLMNTPITTNATLVEICYLLDLQAASVQHRRR